MTTHEAERRFGLWTIWLAADAGAASVLFLFAEADILGGKPLSQSLPWYFIWAAIQLAVTFPGVTLLVLRVLPGLVSWERLKLAFGHLAVAWLTLLAFGLRTGGDESIWLSSFASTVLVTLVGGSAALLVLSYALLSRNALQGREEVFP